jgi:uncharacterized membrane protein
MVQAPALAIVLPIGMASIVLLLRYLSGSPLPADALARRGTTDPNVLASKREERGVMVAGGAVPASIATEHVFVLILLFASMLLLFGTEVVYIKDSFDNRMNTVFKLYFQAWEMLAIVGAYAVVAIGGSAFPIRVAERHAPAPRSSGGTSRAPMLRVGVVGWLAVAAVIVVAAFIYVPAAVAARSDGFNNFATLNGLDYFQRAQGDDAAAIDWLNRNVSGTPTIVEATGGSYSAFSEVAWMTGIPTLLGWDFHEIQWRGSSVIPLEDERKRDIDSIYRSIDIKATQALLAKDGVTFVYVGPMEQQVYGQDQAGLSKFGQFMDPVFKNPGVTIYKVRGAS